MKNENVVKVVGLYVEKYVGESVDGSNCDFTYEPYEFERYHLVVRDRYGRYVITLDEYQGECGSGWTAAMWGSMEVKTANKNIPFTHVPKKDLTIEGYEIELGTAQEDCENNVFSYSADGGDEYYPSGFVYVNMNLFTELKRSSGKRIVYIFTGKSGVGKTSLASHLEGLTVYETDSSETLPEVIVNDVIVVGNRYSFTIDDVKNRIFGDPKIVVVQMED